MWGAVGARPVYQINRNFAVIGEYGLEYLYDETRKGAKGAEVLSGLLHKGTVAAAVTLDKEFYARPEIRLFATYATWDPELNGLSINYDWNNPIKADSAFGDERNMSVLFGISIEAWF